MILHPAVQNYDWGSPTALRRLKGERGAAPQPEAEFWYGVCGSASSTFTDGTSLAERIRADPVGELGSFAVLDSHLAFLAKIMAVEKPLSLQAHPPREIAELGFRAEEELHISRDSAVRNYPDPNHKPELVIALEEFQAFAGFRPVDESFALFDELGIDPSLLGLTRSSASSASSASSDQRVLKQWCSTLFSLGSHDSADAVGLIRSGASDYLDLNGGDGQWSGTIGTLKKLSEMYPSDPGVLVACLLSWIALKPGEALYVGPGQLHAYLSGLAVEVMANSNNVLRGGLTNKHVDSQELLKVLDFSPVSRALGRRLGANSAVVDEVRFSVPMQDFAVTRYEVKSRVHNFTLNTRGPEMLICVRGSFAVVINGETFSVRSTEAAWLPASAGTVKISAESRTTLFRVGSGKQ